jgi:RNA polymerase sigma-70 factor (ECF subfamily)
MSAALLSVLFSTSSDDSAGSRSDTPHTDADTRAADTELLARLRSGEESAYRDLITRYNERLSRFAFGIVRARDVAADIAHDVLLRVWERRESWEPEHSLKSYLFGAARNRALDELKHRGVHARAESAIVETVTHRATSTPDVVDQLSFDAMAAALRSAIAGLPERRRTALKLRYEEGMTYPAIADVLGVSVKSAEQLVALTVQELRKTLRRFR